MIGSKIESNENEVVKVLKIYSDKNTRSERFNAIVEMNNDTIEQLIQKGRMNIDWDECKIHKYVQVNRCYKCLGFNHVAKVCKNKLACSKCTGEHNAQQCTAEGMKCVNCTAFNLKNVNTVNFENVCTEHHAFSRECHVLKLNIERMNGNERGE